MRDETLAKGIIGTASPIIGVITSFQEQIEFWLRFGGLVVGLGTGVLMFISLWRGMRKTK